jgi:hypothetical protein
MYGKILFLTHALCIIDFSQGHGERQQDTMFLMLCYIYLYSPHVFGDDVLKCFSGTCKHMIYRDTWICFCVAVWRWRIADGGSYS